jgi:hypothetical protein
MIQKLRNKGLIRLGLGFGLMFVAVVLAGALAQTSARNLGYALGIILAIIGTLIYLFGLVDLAKAKGYDSSIAAVTMLVCLLCLPIISLFVVTPVVLFVLKDKTHRHRGYR